MSLASLQILHNHLLPEHQQGRTLLPYAED